MGKKTSSRKLPVRQIPEKPERSPLQQRLTTIRKRAGRSQAAFAKELGIRAPQWNRYERGGRWPDPPVLVKIGQLTGVSLSWLLLGQGPMLAEELHPVLIPMPIDLKLQRVLDLVSQIYRRHNEPVWEALDRNLHAFRTALIAKVLVDSGKVSPEELRKAEKTIQEG